MTDYRDMHRRWHLPVLGLVAAFLVAGAPQARAAGFDCAKASSKAERLVCTDPALSAVDDKLTTIYKAAQSAVDPSGKSALRREQTNWLRFTRDVCDNRSCLTAAYAARIALLAGKDRYIVDPVSCVIPDGESACQSVVQYRDTSIRITSFNQSLRHQGRTDRILGCWTLIGLPTGTTGGNVRYGGYCVLEKNGTRSMVDICNDDMIGQFAITPVTPPAESRRRLVNFTYQCPGG